MTDLPAPPEVIVRPGRADDLRYLDHLQGRNRNALGFLPWSALRDYLNRGRVLLVTQGHHPAGHFLTLPSGKIVQACVEYDLRRRYLATALLNGYLATLNPELTPSVGCWCADDLDANSFWQAAGFTHDATRELRQAARLRRTHRHWTKDVSRVGSPNLQPLAVGSADGSLPFGKVPPSALPTAGRPAARS